MLETGLKEYDKFPISSFKLVEETLWMVGNALIKLCSVLFHYLNNYEGNVLYMYQTGKRYPGMRLIVPWLFRALT